MPRRTVALLLCLGAVCTIRVRAQDLGNLQIHGFATQGFLFSSHNNYLTMESSGGSPQWTEGALSLTDPLSDNLRFGIQLHMYQMGQIGGPYMEVEWASGDYKINDQLGFRAGRVKIPLGLYNDSQVVDPLFLWILLPQCTYPNDDRDFHLSVDGGELYGSADLGKRGGRVQYRGYVGESRLDNNGGYVLQLAETGFTFPTPPSGKTFGGDVQWVTPSRGLTVGASAQSESLEGSGPEGTLRLAPSLTLAYYAEWRRGKLHLAGEYWRTPLELEFNIGGIAYPAPVDQRAWYPMVDYRVMRRLQVGTYYSHYVDKSADTSQPESYSKDWVIAGRYDFNQYFYGKIESHFLHGTALGYYTSVNANGLKPDSNMLAARIGFTF
jgi:hypothetical protein